jgi:hypothetical protein
MKVATDFYDIFDYYHIPFWQTLWFKVSVCVTVLLLIALIVYFIVTRKKRELEPWEWATEKIQQLSLEKCLTKNDYKKFYFDLTLILKQYLHKRYAWKTVDKTDEELIEYLHKQGFDETLLEALKKMLEGAVWIKFAGNDVIKAQADADFKTAFSIIKKTISRDTNSLKNKKNMK